MKNAPTPKRGFYIINREVFTLTPEECAVIDRWDKICADFERENAFVHPSESSAIWYGWQVDAKSGNSEALAQVERWPDLAHYQRVNELKFGGACAKFHQQHKDKCRADLAPIFERIKKVFQSLRREYIAARGVWFKKLNLPAASPDDFIIKCDHVVGVCDNFLAQKTVDEVRRFSDYDAKLLTAFDDDHAEGEAKPVELAEAAA